MQASCQCGAVQFKTPIPEPLDLYHCHCIECRKQSSSAFGTSAIFPAFLLPENLPLSCYTRKTDSGGLMDCYFCTVCGVRILHQLQGKEAVSVKGGCLEGLDWSKAKHIWCSRAVVKIPENAQKWDKEPSS